jgi:flagellin
MALNSINTNVAAMRAQGNIGRASEMAGSSIARLSSGNRIVKASDDVAAMSAGTSLRTTVTTLKMALINTSQGSSLLQVADGALNQITDILQRQKAIAVQAGSGSLTSSERSFLNQEFQNLTQEVQRLSEQTNFNGVSLLDGVLTKTVEATDLTTTAATAKGSLTFSTNAVGGGAGADRLTLNGVLLQAVTAGPVGNQFLIGATINDTLTNLATFLNASTNTAFSGHKYSVAGNTLNIESKSAGVGAQNFIFGGLNPTSNSGTIAAANNWVGIANSANLDGPDFGSFNNVFTVNLGAISATQNVISQLAAPVAGESATTPIAAGGVLTATIGGVATVIYTAPPAATVGVNVSLNDIADAINAGTHGIKAQVVGYSGNYNIQLRNANPDVDNLIAAANGGDIAATGTFITTSRTQAGAAGVVVTGPTTTHIQVSGLGGGGTTGLSAANTVGVGAIGNNVLTDQVQTRSKSVIIFPPIAAASLATTLASSVALPVSITIGAAAADATFAQESVAFAFTTNTVATAGSQEISIGATLEETIDNAASAINKYVGTGIQNFDLNQIRAYRDGTNLVIESVDYGDTRHLDNSGATATANVNVVLSAQALTAGVSVTAAALNSGATTGITASAVTNKDFIGTISGFKAVHTGAVDTVNLSVKVGDFTYTANAVDTTATAATTVRLASEGGGYFDIELRANAGTAVTTQAAADTFASRLDAAFTTINFYQNRDVSSFEAVAPVVTDGVVTGSFLGAKVKISSTDFSSVKIEDISVTAPLGSSPNGKIEFTINGEKYSSLLALGGKLGSNQTYKFVSASDANKFLEFTTGNSTIQFDTAAKAAAFEEALETALGVGTANEALTFQVGATSDDALAIGLAGVTTTDLNISTLDVLTQATAALAADAIDAAIDKVTSVRAEVGALQSRFNFAAANVESSISNQDAARGVLLDTDIAAESTAFSTAQVQLQAGISVLAQANLLPQNLLKLIG